ncbi:hypothetical protein HID58_071808, partial [Brassica napus]
SKVSTKIGVIESLLSTVDILLLGGGMIYTFYKAQGHAVGSSLLEEDKLDLARSLMEKAKSKGVSLLLPTDVVIADKFAPDANSKLQRYSGGVSYIKTTTTTVVYGKALPTSPHLFTSSPSVFSSRAQALHRSSLSPLFKLRRPAVNGCEEAPP